MVNVSKMFKVFCRVQKIMRVEEKFGEQIFRVLSEMRGKILYIDPKISKKNRIEINPNVGKMFSKFENRALKTLFEI